MLLGKMYIELLSFWGVSLASLCCNYSQVELLARIELIGDESESRYI